MSDTQPARSSKDTFVARYIVEFYAPIKVFPTDSEPIEYPVTSAGQSFLIQPWMETIALYLTVDADSEDGAIDKARAIADRYNPSSISNHKAMSNHWCFHEVTPELG